MASLIYKNVTIAALENESIMVGGQPRNKQNVQIIAPRNGEMVLAGGIEVWDDSIEKLGLRTGQTYAELHCAVSSRYSQKDNRWYWRVQAYKVVQTSEEQNNGGGQDPFDL